ncbi:MAG: hypothetical protein U0325_10315 [Polyangiales bacterium]
MRISIDDGRLLPRAEVDEMQTFRRSIMRMKPEVDLDLDHARFSSFVTRCPLVMRARCREGVLRGTFVARWVEGESEGRKWRLVLPEYGFFHPTLRGTGAVPFAIARTIVAAPGIFVGRELLLGGVFYPTGLLALEGVFGAPQFADDPTLDPVERDCVARVIDEIAGPRFDPATGRVTMPTRPPPPSARWFTRMERRATFRAYTGRCPNWLDGHALPGLLRLRARSAGVATARAMRRSLERRWAGDGA